MIAIHGSGPLQPVPLQPGDSQALMVDESHALSKRWSVHAFVLAIPGSTPVHKNLSLAQVRPRLYASESPPGSFRFRTLCASYSWESNRSLA